MMKRLYAIWMAGVLLLAPALPVAAASHTSDIGEDVQVEADAAVDGEEIVVIADEDVPLSAIPMMTTGQPRGVTSHLYIYAGVTLMLLSGIGMLYLNLHHRRQAK